MKGGYSVEIDKVDEGYIVKAGCLVLTFGTSELLLSELSRWMAAPRAVEAEYAKKYRDPEVGVLGYTDEGRDAAMGSAAIGLVNRVRSATDMESTSPQFAPDRPDKPRGPR